jgi:hypothetical protein
MTTTTLGIANDDIPKDELRLAADIARLENKNQHFAALGPAEKRVAIAKDVLQWLRLGRLTGQPGAYLWTHKPQRPDDWVETAVVNGFSCTACALGSLFAACADRVGGFGRELMSFPSYHMREQLKPYFEMEQLVLIEMAFEGFAEQYEEGHRYRNPAATAYCADLGREQGDERLALIMRNIVRNKGTFVPEDKR